MTLIFVTPSKRCPNRAYNGGPVEVCTIERRRYVKRAGRRLRQYVVRTPAPPGVWFLALEDELFIDPQSREE